MTTKPFDPKFMKVGVLTAALQELTPREVRDPDPDRAIEEWVEFAKELGAGYIQLSAALHPTETDVPPEAMLDPVANTLDLRKPFDKERAKRVQAALKATGVGLSDVGYFDNLLHHDPAIRKKKHDFMLRVFDTESQAALLGFLEQRHELLFEVDQVLVHAVLLVAADEAANRVDTEQHRRIERAQHEVVLLFPDRRIVVQHVVEVADLRNADAVRIE